MVLDYFQVAVLLNYLSETKMIQHPILVKSAATDALSI